MLTQKTSFNTPCFEGSPSDHALSRRGAAGCLQSRTMPISNALRAPAELIEHMVATDLPGHVAAFALARDPLGDRVVIQLF